MNFNRNLRRSYFILWTEKWIQLEIIKIRFQFFMVLSNRIINHVHLVLVHLKFVCYIRPISRESDILCIVPFFIPNQIKWILFADVSICYFSFALILQAFP